MDEIEDFFNISKDFKRESAPVPKPIIESAPSSSRSVKRECGSPERAFKKIPKVEVKCEDHASQRHTRFTRKCIPEETMNDHYDEEGFEERRSAHWNIDDGVYNRYVFNTERDASLPIHDSKDEILKAIRRNAVVILKGDTGCGKTTQVPQYLLDDGYRRGEYCKIICTQPRRIAAISIAKRVCVEREWPEGTVVGYQVGLHANHSDDTRLLYCTTGVLLQKLIRTKTLLPYTHIILDEVHERDQNIDFLMIIIRRLLLTNSKHVKIILMSATMETKEFEDYFRIRNKPATVVKADYRRLYQVKEFYLCDLGRINNHNAEVSETEPGISMDMFNLALKLIVVIDNIEKQDASIDSEAQENGDKSSILIFLPGISEIDQMLKKIEQLCRTEGDKLKVCCIRLHSIISPNEQVKVFHRPPPGFRKVILATNIAESSITVPDVKFVIDFCLTRLLVTDSSTNLTALQLSWASKANCRQRAGRAGRVMNGRVYRLVTRTFFDSVLEDYGKPEIIRCPLENVVLNAKLLDMGSPPEVLSLALSPPNLCDIQNNILTLKEVGGLYKTADGVYTTDDGDITFIGKIMAALPLDIRLTRLIVLGYVFSALEESIIMAAGLSVRSIFKAGTFKGVEEHIIYMQKMDWADGTGSDLIAIVRAYKMWLTLPEDDNAQHMWANRYRINLRSIREMKLLVKELQVRLSAFGIKQHNIYEPPQWLTGEKAIILKIIIAGAFYPNYFVYSKLHDPDKERANFHLLCGRDLCRTVYYTNFDTRHIGQLYTRSIKELLKTADIDPGNIDVSFQANSERILVSFKNEHSDEADDEYANSSNGASKKYRHVKTPGAVCIDVYKAVAMRYLNLPNSFNVMDARAGIKYAEDHGLGTMTEGVWVPTKRLAKNAELVVLPSVFQKDISGIITHIESCSKFYFQPLSEAERIKEINEMLNNPFDIESCKFPHPGAVAKGMILAAPFENKYHRGKVLNIVRRPRHATICDVIMPALKAIFFMDYGNRAHINFEDLRYLSQTCKYLVDIPPRLFQCRLAMIEPSAIRSPSSQWTDEAMEYIQQHADSGVAEIEVFSVVDGVSNVMIKKDNSTINDILVEKGLARSADECFMSKTDHDCRIRKQSVANRFLDDDHSKQNEEYLRSLRPEVDMDAEPPPSELCTKTIQLRGPFSPLESPIFSAVRAGTWKSVRVERYSVNYMNIDSDPKDMYERLIVAAGITEGVHGDSFVARSTTRMPNIHGFGALVTMMFCPTMQIKCNKTRTKYVAVLAGLGFDEKTYRPLYGEHDLVLNLDVDILQNDIELINEIRLSMDALLYTDVNEERPNINPNDLEDLTLKIKNCLLRLISKQRKYIEIHVNSNDNIWEKVDEEEVIEPPSVHGKRSLFPPLNMMRLYDEKFDHIHALNMHCHELHSLRQYDGAIQATKCRLCAQPIENIAQLRIHLLTQLHRDREHQIRFQPAST